MQKCALCVLVLSVFTITALDVWASERTGPANCDVAANGWCVANDFTCSGRITIVRYYAANYTTVTRGSCHTSTFWSTCDCY